MYYMKLSDWADIATIVATLVGVVGAVVAIVTYIKDRQDNKHNNELTGMPDFYFTGPNECVRFGVSFCHSNGPLVPKLATTCKSQEMIYWFNMINCGKFAAKDVRIAVISQSEYKNVMNLSADRWKSIKYWSGMPSGGSGLSSTDGDLIPIYTTKGDLEIKPNDQELYVLLEYVSSYSNIRYKRLYKWCISSERVAEDMKIDVSSSSNNICEFNEEDMTKNDFDGMAYSKIKTKDNSSKGSVNIDEQIKVGEEFYRDNNMLTLEQTQLKHDFKKMRLGRPVFLKDVQLQSATNSNEIKSSKSLHGQGVLSAEDWLNLY